MLSIRADQRRSVVEQLVLTEQKLADLKRETYVPWVMLVAAEGVIFSVQYIVLFFAQLSSFGGVPAALEQLHEDVVVDLDYLTNRLLSLRQAAVDMFFSENFGLQRESKVLGSLKEAISHPLMAGIVNTVPFSEAIRSLETAIKRVQPYIGFQDRTHAIHDFLKIIDAAGEPLIVYIRELEPYMIFLKREHIISTYKKHLALFVNRLLQLASSMDKLKIGSVNMSSALKGAIRNPLEDDSALAKIESFFALVFSFIKENEKALIANVNNDLTNMYFSCEFVVQQAHTEARGWAAEMINLDNCWIPWHCLDGRCPIQLKGVRVSLVELKVEERVAVVLAAWFFVASVGYYFYRSYRVNANALNTLETQKFSERKLHTQLNTLHARYARLVKYSKFLDSAVLAILLIKVAYLFQSFDDLQGVECYAMLFTVVTYTAMRVTTYHQHTQRNTKNHALTARILALDENACVEVGELEVSWTRVSRANFDVVPFLLEEQGVPITHISTQPNAIKFLHKHFKVDKFLVALKVRKRKQEKLRAIRDFLRSIGSGLVYETLNSNDETCVALRLIIDPEKGSLEQLNSFNGVGASLEDERTLIISVQSMDALGDNRDTLSAVLKGMKEMPAERDNFVSPETSGDHSRALRLRNFSENQERQHRPAAGAAGAAAQAVSPDNMVDTASWRNGVNFNADTAELARLGAREIEARFDQPNHAPFSSVAFPIESRYHPTNTLFVCISKGIYSSLKPQLLYALINAMKQARYGTQFKQVGLFHKPTHTRYTGEVRLTREQGDFRGYCTSSVNASGQTLYQIERVSRHI